MGFVPRIHLQGRTTGVVAALVMSLALVGLTAGPADATAKKPPKDQDIYCVIEENGNGEIEFFLPGQTYYNRWTNEIQTCGPDGQWKSRVTSPSTSPHLPTGGGVYAP